MLGLVVDERQFGAGPDRRQRDHMREIEGRDRRLPDVGVDMTRERTEPRLERVHPFDHAGEVTALDDFLDQGELGVKLLDRILEDCELPWLRRSRPLLYAHC